MIFAGNPYLYDRDSKTEFYMLKDDGVKNAKSHNQSKKSQLSTHITFLTCLPNEITFLFLTREICLLFHWVHQGETFFCFTGSVIASQVLLKLVSLESNLKLFQKHLSCEISNYFNRSIFLQAISSLPIINL